MQCRSCDSEVAEHAKFCGKCGAVVAPEVVAETVSEMACPACDAPCVSHAKFCGKCGYAMVQTVAAEPDELPPSVSLSEPVVPELRPEPAPAVEPAPAPVAVQASGKALWIGGALVLVMLVIFAWWLNSRQAHDASEDGVIVDPSAESHPAPWTAQPSVPAVEAPVPETVVEAVKDEVIVEREPEPSIQVAPVVRDDESQRAAQRKAALQREAEQRARDKAKLERANQTLDDLLN